MSSNDTLTVALSILPDAKRKELVTALNWLLQDNCCVNDFAADKDYLIDKYISLTLNFTHIFQEFTRVLLTVGGEINGETIYNFFTEMEKDKNDISKTVATATNELLQFLLERSKDLALPDK